MNTHKIYLCGPLAGCSTFEALAWREEALRLLGKENCINPADTWVKEESELSGSEKRRLVNGDLNSIEKCKGLLYCAWKPSFGSPMELFYANQRRKLTATVITGPISPWIYSHSDFIGQTVAEAARWLAIQLRFECPLLRRDQ